MAPNGKSILKYLSQAGYKLSDTKFPQTSTITEETPLENKYGFSNPQAATQQVMPTMIPEIINGIESRIANNTNFIGADKSTKISKLRSVPTKLTKKAVMTFEYQYLSERDALASTNKSMPWLLSRTRRVATVEIAKLTPFTKTVAMATRQRIELLY
ncbi:hypothetical protein ACUKBL_05395 [Furfurilactobacillus rossiae]